MHWVFSSGFLVQDEESPRFELSQCVVWYQRGFWYRKVNVLQYQYVVCTHWAFWYKEVNVLQYTNASFIPIEHSGTGKSTFCSISMCCLFTFGFLVQGSQRFVVYLFPLGFLVQGSQRFAVYQCVVYSIGHSGTGKSTFCSISMRCLFPLGFLVQGSQHFVVYQCIVYSHWRFWYRKVNVLQYINALFIPIGHSGTGKSTFRSISMRCLFPLGFPAQESQRFAVYQSVVYSHWAFWYRKVNVSQYINALFIPIGHSGTGKSKFYNISMRCLFPLGVLVQKSRPFTVYQCVDYSRWDFWYKKVSVLQNLTTLLHPNWCCPA